MLFWIPLYLQGHFRHEALCYHCKYKVILAVSYYFYKYNFNLFLISLRIRIVQPEAK